MRKTVMLTGDAEPWPKPVSAELGIDEVPRRPAARRQGGSGREAAVRGRPKENLAFVGDGINDAPVLSRADIGIAMGAMGSDAAIEAADVVLMDDDPAKIARAIRIWRRTMRHRVQNIVFALARQVCLPRCWARWASRTCGRRSSPTWA